MGYGLRTNDWRYVVWVPWNSDAFKAEWNQPIMEELYDHRDPRCNEKGNFDLCENQNLADDESLAKIKEELLMRVRTISDTYNLNAWNKWREEGGMKPGP